MLVEFIALLFKFLGLVGRILVGWALLDGIMCGIFTRDHYDMMFCGCIVMCACKFLQKKFIVELCMLSAVVYVVYCTIQDVSPRTHLPYTVMEKCIADNQRMFACLANNM